MRNILFKAKRVDNGEWVEGLPFYSHGLGEWKITHSDGWRPTYSNPDQGESTLHTNIDPKTLCQYTGLKDKNGKMIFEGDVLAIEEEDTKYDCIRHYSSDVKYDNCDLVVKSYDSKGDYDTYFGSFFNKNNRHPLIDFEITSNIHDK